MRKNSLLTAIFVIAAEIVVGVMSIVFCLSFLLSISTHFLGNFDRTIIDAIYSFRSEQLNVLMQTITFFGGGIFLVTGIILLLFAIWQKHKISTFNFAFLLFFGTVINLILKEIFQRARPENLPLVYESSYSFPSGHAMNSFIFYSLVAYFIIRNTKNQNTRTVVIGLFSFIIFLIGLSRVYLGAHYPSDVIAGYIAGILWLVLVIIVEKTARKYKLFKKFS